MPRTGGRFLITGNKCPDQCGHNDFVARKEGSPGYFCVITGPHPVTLWVSQCSHIFVWYSAEQKEALVNALVMEEIIIPIHSVFIGNGCLHHAGTGWRGFHALRYHLYLKPEGIEIPDAVAFSLIWSLERSTVTTRKSNNGKNVSGTGGSANDEGMRKMMSLKAGRSGMSSESSSDEEEDNHDFKDDNDPDNDNPLQVTEIP